MIKPKIPLNERERLEVLRSYNILNTLPEMDYDAIVEIAVMICDTPIAMISMVDKDRQFFKSKMGISDRETSRNTSFCAHAINTPVEILEILDARLDERFADNPVVTGEPHVIFYAGMPLVTPDGFALGTLCLIDNKPRQLTNKQKQALISLSKQVVNLLELRKKNELLMQTQKQLELHAGEMKDFAYEVSHNLKEPLLIHILLVEDNEGDIFLFKEALKEGKMETKLSVVKDGKQALDFLEKKGENKKAELPHLVLLDINLPKVNGHEVLQQVKSNNKLKHIPVIMFTTSSSEKDIMNSYKNHVNSFITKPQELDDFFKVVKSIEDFWLSVVSLPLKNK